MNENYDERLFLFCFSPSFMPSACGFSSDVICVTLMNTIRRSRLVDSGQLRSFSRVWEKHGWHPELFPKGEELTVSHYPV